MALAGAGYNNPSQRATKAKPPPTRGLARGGVPGPISGQLGQASENALAQYNSATTAQTIKFAPTGRPRHLLGVPNAYDNASGVPFI